MKELSGELDKMAPIVEELSGLNSELSGLQTQLENAKNSNPAEIQKSIEKTKEDM
jgi:hypothetical protein